MLNLNHARLKGARVDGRVIVTRAKIMTRGIDNAINTGRSFFKKYSAANENIKENSHPNFWFEGISTGF
jgi:hypothetical protein